MTCNLSDGLILEIKRIFEKYAGLSLSSGQILNLLQDNKDLKKQLIEYDSPSDTYDRDCLMDALAYKTAGMAWPNNSTRGSMDSFNEKYLKGCKEFGYEQSPRMLKADADLKR